MNIYLGLNGAPLSRKSKIAPHLMLNSKVLTRKPLRNQENTWKLWTMKYFSLHFFHRFSYNAVH